MLFSPGWGTNGAPQNTLAGFEGHFEAGEERRKGRKGGKMK